jgi:hypothetical protein
MDVLNAYLDDVIIYTIISHGQIRPLKKRAECLINLTKIQNLDKLQQFMGLANYSREYIKNFAEIARPLYALMIIENKKNLPKKRNGALDGKKIVMTWTEEAQTAFYEFREI